MEQSAYGKIFLTLSLIATCHFHIKRKLYKRHILSVLTLDLEKKENVKQCTKRKGEKNADYKYSEETGSKNHGSVELITNGQSR